MRDYKKIKAYVLGDKLAVELYKATKSFPRDELYGLTSQIRRAAVSVPANIVEGASRKHKKEYLNFLYISRGSIAEVEYLLQLSLELKYLTEKKYNDINIIREEAAKTLWGLIEAVESEL